MSYRVVTKNALSPVFFSVNLGPLLKDSILGPQGP